MGNKRDIGNNNRAIISKEKVALGSNISERASILVDILIWLTEWQFSHLCINGLCEVSEPDLILSRHSEEVAVSLIQSLTLEGHGVFVSWPHRQPACSHGITFLDHVPLNRRATIVVRLFPRDCYMVFVVIYYMKVLWTKWWIYKNEIVTLQYISQYFHSYCNGFWAVPFRSDRDWRQKQNLSGVGRWTRAKSKWGREGTRAKSQWGGEGDKSKI